MARSWFGGGIGDFTVGQGPGGALVVTSTSLTLWDSQSGGTRYSNLLVAGVAASSVRSATSGQIPRFQGPDGVTEMWADAGGARVLLTAAGSGSKGDPGVGVPDGGTSGQVLVRTSTGTAWADPSSGSVPDASTTTKGAVELATSTETTTGTDPGRAVTPKGLADTLAGMTVVAGVLVWRYAGGSYPALPATKPTGVVLLEAVGPVQPASVPSWVGTGPTSVPATYIYAPLT